MASFYQRIERGPNGASPSTLEHLAFGAILEKLGRNLIFLIRDAEGTFLKALGDYLAQFPPVFSQILREHLIEKYLKYFKTPRKDFMSIVFNNDVKRLKVNSFSIHYNFNEWMNIIRLTTNIASLTVEAHRPCQPSPGRVDPFVRAAILQWSGLRELRLAAAPLSGDTLAAVGRHCRQLRVLDLRNTHTRCAHLIRLFCSRRRLAAASGQSGNYSTGGNPLCSTLEVLVLSDTLVRSRGVIAALRFCPRLRSLGHCAYLATAVKRLQVRQPGIRLCLKHVIFHEDSNLGLKDLLQVCPEIEYLTVLLQDKSFSRIDFNEAPCPPFERVTKLMLMHVHHDDVLEALRKLPLLVELQVGSIGVDIFQIGRLCPQLETLHLIHEPRRHIFTNSNQHIKIFQKLQQLKVTCRLTFECASLIFMSASLLRSVYLVRISHLKDHHLHQWLNVNPLYYLESWTLLYTALTQISARLLVQKCPRLSRLGLLSRWDVRSWEYEALSNELGPCFSLEWASDGPLDIIVLVRQLEDDSSSQEEI